VKLATGLVLVVCAACRPSGGPVPAGTYSISLERGSCMGECPVYSVTVASDGSVRYEGSQGVAVPGEATASIPADSAAALLQAFEALAFDSLPDRYQPDDAGCSPYVADLPMLVFTVRQGDRAKRVEYDPGCAAAPRALRDLARRIDRVAGSSRWTGR
jgi:hypothetical protein